MNIKNAILSVLNFRKGEGSAIFLLMSYSFFMGASIAFYFVASNALFLEKNGISELPYAYMGGGAIAYLFWVAYSRLEKKIKFSSLLIFGILFLIISVGLLTMAYFQTENKWWSYVLFIWIRVFMFISYVGFWGMAQKIFDLRQGKRLFGLISSGEVISDMIGFFSIPLLLTFITSDDLFYISLICLGVCILVLIVILNKFSSHLSDKPSAEAHKEEKIKGKLFSGQSEKPFKKYYILISSMAIVPMLGLVFANFAFLDQTNVQYQDKELLAGFLAIFFGFIAVAELIVKTFISGRVISKYGLRTGLTIMPAILSISVFLSAVIGTFYGTIAMFFSFVALTQLLERVFRTGIYDPSFQILYQPLPKEKRFHIQSRIEGVAKATGNILAGGILLLFVNFQTLNIVYFNYLFFTILVIWSNISFKMYKYYRQTLKRLIGLQKDLISSPEDKKEINNRELHKLLSNTDVDSFEYKIAILERFDPRKIDPIIKKMLSESTEKLKKKILEKIKHKELIISFKLIEKCLKKGQEHPIQPMFKEQIEILKSSENLSFDFLAGLAKSSDADDRRYAAKLLSFSGRYNSYKLLIELLHDEDSEVKKAALVSSGKMGRHELWSTLIDNLQSSEFNNTAAYAIVLIGAPILNELDLYFNKFGADKKTRIEIIRLYSKIGGKRATDLLREKIDFPDKEIRDEALRSLNKLHYKASISEKPFIRQAIEEEIEIVVWIMATVLDLDGDPLANNLLIALKQELSEKKQHIFLLLSMIYDPVTINHILQNIEDGSKDSKVYAIEIIDLIVSTEIKEKLLILLEDQTYSDCVHGFRDFFPQESMSVSKRLIDIINKDYTKINRWTKACALEIINKFPSEENILILEANVINPDPLISETSAYSFNKLDRYKFALYKEKMDKYSYELNELSEKIRLKNKYIPIIDKVKLLKDTDLFKSIPEMLLTDIASEAVEVFMSQNDKLFLKEDENSLFILINGQVNKISNGICEEIYKNNSLFVNIPGIDNIYGGSELIASASSLLFKINLNILDDLDLLAENYDIILKLISLLDTQQNSEVNYHD